MNKSNIMNFPEDIKTYIISLEYDLQITKKELYECSLKVK
jgi:hypothetical protein